MNDRLGAVVAGAAAGLMGTLVLQGLRSSSAALLPGTMPPIEKDPGEYMVEQAEDLLPSGVRERVPALIEAGAARSIAAGYGITAGAVYGALRPAGGSALSDGAALGLGTWAAGYMGWLPLMGLMPPLAEQEAEQILGPVVRHVLFGIATVAAFDRLRPSGRTRGPH